MSDRRLRNLQSVFRHQMEPPEPVKKPSPWRKRLGALGPVGIILLFVLGKLKFLIPLLKFTKFSTLISMFVSVWAYALFFGWPFSLGFVLLIFVHELGHGLVMQQQGIRAGAPVFIPFVGAVIAMRSMPKDAYVEALVGIGGPILGSIGALFCLIVGWVTGSPFWYALAYVGFFLNLFNLIPISPLDGGRIVGVISRWIWVLGYVIGIATFIVTKSPILFLILLLGLFSIWNTIRGPREGYFDVEPAKRYTIAVAYFVLLVLLAFGMSVSKVSLESQSPADSDQPSLEYSM